MSTTKTLSHTFDSIWDPVRTAVRNQRGPRLQQTVITENRRRPPLATRWPCLNRAEIADTGLIPEGLRLIRNTERFLLTEAKTEVMEDINHKPINVMKVTGLFQQCDELNANHRIYPYAIMTNAVKSIQEDVSKRGVYGEYDHPETAKVHLDRISHLITKVWMDGKKVYGQAEILDNQPLGACLRGLFERKCQVGISSRGVGDMTTSESNGSEVHTVCEGYTIVTWDAVIDPSVTGATLAVMESLNRRVRPLKESRTKLPRRVYEDALVKAIKGFFDLN